MERIEVLEQIKAIFIDTLDIENIEMTEETQAADIDEWDSLTHIQLVVALEKAYDIRFNTKEIQEWNNVGEIIDSIIAKK